MAREVHPKPRDLRRARFCVFLGFPNSDEFGYELAICVGSGFHDFLGFPNSHELGYELAILPGRFRTFPSPLDGAGCRVLQ